MNPLNTKILLIEDDDHLRKPIVEHLKETGEYEIEEFQSGQPAIDRLKENPEAYRAVILDWAIGGNLRGDEVLEEIKRINPYLPTIAITGNIDAGSEAFRKGASRYFRKSPDLYKSLEEALGDIAAQDAVLSFIVLSIQRLTNFQQCLAWRYIERENKFVLAAWADKASITVEDQQTILQENSAIRNVIRNRAVEFFANVHEKSYHESDFPKRHSWKSMFCIPLLHKGEILGMLEGYPSDRIKLTPEQVNSTEEMLQTLAEQLGETAFNADAMRKNRELLNLSASLSEKYDLQAIAEALLTKGLDLLEADAGWLYLHDFEKGDYALASSKGISVQIPKHLKAEKKTVLGETAQGKVVNINDTENSPIEPLPISKMLSQITAPLRRSDITIAIMVFASERNNAFSEADESLLRALAEVSAPALDQAKMRQHVREINELVAEGKEEQILEKVTYAAYDMLGKPVTLWRIDKGLTELTVKAARGVSQKFIKEAKIIFSGADDSLIAHAFLHRQTVNRADLFDPNEVPRLQLDKLAEAEGWKSTLVVPLFDSESRPLGALVCHHTQEGKFSPYEEDTLEYLASHAATAFENLNYRQNLELLREIGEVTVQEATDEKKVLERFAKMASQLTGAPCIAIYPYDTEAKTFYDSDKVVTYGLKRRRSKGVTSKPREKGLAYIIRHVGYLVVHDIESRGIDEPDLSKVPEQIRLERLWEFIREEKFIRREDIKAFMGISLRATESSKGEGEEEVGILYINYRTPHKFTPSEINLIQLFAHQVANRLRSAWLMVRQQEQFQIVKTTARLATAKDRNEILQITFKCALESIDKAKGLIISIEKDLLHRVLHQSGLDIKQVDRESLDTVVISGKPNEVKLVIKGKEKEEEETYIQWSIPIQASGIVVAVLILVTNSPLRTEKKETLKSLAAAAGTALEKVQSYEERTRQLEALQKVVEAIGSATDPQPIILDQACKLFDASYGSICLCLPESDEILFGAIWEKGKPLDVVPPEKQRTKIGEGIIGQAAKSGEPIYVEDVRVRKDYVRWYEDTLSELAIPLTDTKGKVIGVLNLESTALSAFTKADQDLCQGLANVASAVLEKSNLFSTSQKLSQQLQMLYQIMEERDLQKVLERVLEGLNQIVGEGTSSSINLYDEKENAAYCILAAGPGAHLLQVPPRSREKGRGGIFFHAVEKKEAIYIGDTLREIANPPSDRPTLRKDAVDSGVRSFAALPLLRNERVLGVLFIHQTKPIAFTKQLMQSLETFATQAAIAVDNVQKTMDIHVLQEILDAITGRPLNELLHLITEKAAQAAGADYCSMWLGDSNNDGLTLAALHCPSGEIDPNHTRFLSANTPSVNMRVYKTGKYVLLPKVEEAGQDYHRIFQPARSELAIPMRYKSKVIGTLNVESKQEALFSASSVLLLETFADPAAIAIEMARLLRELERYRDELLADLDRKNIRLERRNKILLALAEISQQLTAGIQRSESEILSIIREHAGRIMDTDNMYIALYNPENDEVRFEMAFLDGRAVDVNNEPGWAPRRGGKGRTEWIIKHKTPILTTTRADAEDWYTRPDTKEYVGQTFASWVGVPMLYGEQVLGVIATYHKTEEYKYDREDMDVLMLMARHAAIALTNARLLQNLDRRVQELDALRGLAEELSALSRPA